MIISSNIVLKRYTADKDKSLKWYEWVMNPNTRECDRVLRYSECTAVIDSNQLDGDVMEIPYEVVERGEEVAYIH